ncbi:hypothetical protein, partial [Burkholderia thailandensis]|uniref:hypothetical protein n=1 Tax=Burkholderia thailandensis TaxID=57975 RepID=UPI00217E9E80
EMFQERICFREGVVPHDADVRRNWRGGARRASVRGRRHTRIAMIGTRVLPGAQRENVSST